MVWTHHAGLHAGLGDGQDHGLRAHDVLKVVLNQLDRPGLAKAPLHFFASGLSHTKRRKITSFLFLFIIIITHKKQYFYFLNIVQVDNFFVSSFLSQIDAVYFVLYSN